MLDNLTIILEIMNKILDIITNRSKIKPCKYLYIKEEELKIDCYDFLRQITKTNKSFVPNRYICNYKIDKNDYYANDILEAKCISKELSSYEFSIASTTNKRYEDMECFGYDLVNSPNIKIHPQLISPDSFSKRLSLQLNKTLKRSDILKVRIEYKSYGTMSANKRYIIHSLNYRKIDFTEFQISFNFLERVPDNIRVYEINPFTNTYHFLYKIFPLTNQNNIFIDTFNTKNLRKHNKYIYIF